MTARDSTAEPPAEAFYDARRDVYYTKPVLRGWLHLLWFEVSLVSGTLLLARVHGATRITASAIYTASVCGMFGASALYHRGSWNATWRQRLQRRIRRRERPRDSRTLMGKGPGGGGGMTGLRLCTAGHR